MSENTQPEERLMLEWAQDGDAVTMVNGYSETLHKFEDAQEAAQRLAGWGLVMRKPFKDWGDVLVAEIAPAGEPEPAAEPKPKPVDVELQIIVAGHGLYRFSPIEAQEQLGLWLEEGRQVEEVRAELTEHYGMDPHDYDDVTSLLTLAIVRVQR